MCRSILAATFFLAVISVVLLPGSSTTAQDLLDKLEKKIGGPAATPVAPAYGYLGLTPDEEYKANDGVRVLDVKAGGPAEAAGVMKGDLVKSVDGKRVQTVDEMDHLQKTTTPGQTWRLIVDRGGKLQTVSVKLGTRPAAASAAVSDANPGEAPPGLIPPALVPPTTTPPPAPTPGFTPPASTTLPPVTSPAATDPPPAAGAPIRSRPLDPFAPSAGGGFSDPPAPAPAADSVLTPSAPASSGASLGITVVPLTDEARAAYGLGVRRGALITNVRPGSPADTAGLPIGAVVTTVDGKRIDTADELVAFIRTARPGQEVELGYMQGDRQQRKNVRLGPTSASAAPGASPAVGGGYGSGLSGASGDTPPLISRVERMVDKFVPARGGSTVYDPGEMAELKSRVSELADQVKALKERLDSLEGKASGTAPPPPAPGLGGGFTPMP